MKSREARRREAMNLIVWEIGAVAVLLFCLVISDSTLAVWLNTNSGAVLAIVTTVYAFLTLLLWRATKQQAAITRLTFEASHRPYVIVKAQEPPEEARYGQRSCNLVIENHGAVPAAITAWEVRGVLPLFSSEQPINHTWQSQNPVGLWVGPQTSSMITVRFADKKLEHTGEEVRLYGSVEYRGIGSATYRTDFNAKSSGEWTAGGTTWTGYR